MFGWGQERKANSERIGAGLRPEAHLRSSAGPLPRVNGHGLLLAISLAARNRA